MSRSAPLAASAAAAAAVLLLGACGGDSSEEETGNEGQQSEGASGGEGESAGGGEAPAEGDLEGYWMTGLEPPYNVLWFQSGTATFSNDSGAEVCTGPAAGDTLDLVCQSGSTDFTSATFALEGDSLNVTWESGTQETYQRADDAALDQLPDLGDIPGMEDLQDLQDLPGLDGGGEGGEGE